MANKTKIAIAAISVVALAVAFLLLYPYLFPPVPRERRMARIMADIYTADAILQECQSRGAKDKTIESTYRTVLGHYGLTKADYDSAVAWYSRDPKKFASVYERVVAILSTREDMVRVVAERVDSIEQRIEHINDSLTSDLIGSKLTLNLPLEAKDDSLKTYLKPNGRKYTTAERTFDLDSLRGGHLDVSYKYTISNPGDKDKAKPAGKGKVSPAAAGKAQTPPVYKYPDGFMRVIISYADTTDTRDSLKITVSRRVVQREAKLTVNLRDSVAATSARVVFFENAGLKDMAMTMRDIQVTYKPYDVVDTTNYDSIIPSLFAY